MMRVTHDGHARVAPGRPRRVGMDAVEPYSRGRAVLTHAGAGETPGTRISTRGRSSRNTHVVGPSGQVAARPHTDEMSLAPRAGMEWTIHLCMPLRTTGRCRCETGCPSGF